MSEFLPISSDKTGDLPLIRVVYTRALSDVERQGIEQYLRAKYFQASPPVSLTVARTGDSVLISWPLSASGFALEAADNLTVPNWTAVTSLPIVAGDKNAVTLAVASGVKFYRLKK